MNCYGCVHLKYRGPTHSADKPGGNRTKVAGESPIRVYPDEQVSPGRYECGKFSEVIVAGDKTPEPLVAGGQCKETR